MEGTKLEFDEERRIWKTMHSRWSFVRPVEEYEVELSNLYASAIYLGSVSRLTPRQQTRLRALEEAVDSGSKAVKRLRIRCSSARTISSVQAFCASYATTEQEVADRVESTEAPALSDCPNSFGEDRKRTTYTSDEPLRFLMKDPETTGELTETMKARPVKTWDKGVLARAIYFFALKKLHISRSMKKQGEIVFNQQREHDFCADFTAKRFADVEHGSYEEQSGFYGWLSICFWRYLRDYVDVLTKHPTDSIDHPDYVERPAASHAEAAKTGFHTYAAVDSNEDCPDLRKHIQLYDPDHDLHTAVQRTRQAREKLLTPRLRTVWKVLVRYTDRKTRALKLGCSERTVTRYQQELGQVLGELSW